jgi:hypothetical protein
MAALGTAVNLLDLSTRMDPDGGIATVAELLSQTNSFNGNMVWKEGNLTTGERVTIRTGLPTIYFRRLNQGIQPSKSTTVQVDEGTCMMEGRGQIDKDLAELNGLTSAFRMSENQPRPFTAIPVSTPSSLPALRPASLTTPARPTPRTSFRAAAPARTTRPFG